MAGRPASTVAYPDDREIEATPIEEQARAGDPFPLRQPNQLFRNLGNGKLVDAEKRRDMLGTWMGVFRSEGPTLWRRVRTAASFASANDPRLLVGLGNAAEVTKVTARWPDGSVEEWTELTVDQYTTLAKGSGKVVTPARIPRGESTK